MGGWGDVPGVGGQLQKDFLGGCQSAFPDTHDDLTCREQSDRFEGQSQRKKGAPHDDQGSIHHTAFIRAKPIDNGPANRRSEDVGDGGQARERTVRLLIGWVGG